MKEIINLLLWSYMHTCAKYVMFPTLFSPACLSQWNLDAVERREFAAKKAQLAAAELSKLSKRICGKLFALHFRASVVYFVSARVSPFI